uniref:Vacuolar protein sortingassociated protein putative n=1 Tax=Albugo laibachii Nc14 TaxID=890382 RepID=F0W125_9STRA|nr:vacuolar protein sortingassociated protein putative [Albugo laibachii Nc14]|eukprot:CCA14749.1 vacuolar protein sortingassociated protein putative [Albugo laibachii Nc14]
MSYALNDSSASSHHASIWRVNYHDDMVKNAAMGWHGLGYILTINIVVFVVCGLIFQYYANSTSVSLFRFQAVPHSGKGEEQEAFHSLSKSPHTFVFTLHDWYKLLWKSPLVQNGNHPTRIELQLGPESSFYLLFQVYMCKFLIFLSFFAIVILFPLYMYVGRRRVVDESHNATQNSTTDQSLASYTDWTFGHTTIRSIPNGSVYLWIPVLCCYISSFAFLVFSRKLSQLCHVPSSNAAHNGEISTARDLAPSNMTSTSTTTAPTESSQFDATHDESNGRNFKDRQHLVGMLPSALSSRSLFVDHGIPRHLSEKRMLYLLQQVFPKYFEDVAVVYNLSEFHDIQRKLQATERELQRQRILHQKYEDGRPVSWSLYLLPGSLNLPKLSGFFCIPALRQFLSSSERNQKKKRRLAIKEFEKQERTLETKISMLRAAEQDCLQNIVGENKGAGRAFLIFRSTRYRARFVRRVRHSSIASILSRFPDHLLHRLNRYARELGLTRWSLQAAPEPDDIDWQSVSYPFAKRTIVFTAVNLCILLILFLFTSPVAVTSTISGITPAAHSRVDSVSEVFDKLSDLVDRYVSYHVAKLMISFVPTLILIMINSVLLNILQFAGRIQPIATESDKERTVLRLSVIYLIFNTLFVPSLAFVSIDAALLYLRDSADQLLDMLGMLFLRNSGIFYVSYIVQRSFIGTSVNLLRIGEYVRFAWEKPRALTLQEHRTAVEASPFYIGTQSAVQISMLTIILTFSTVVPLVVPVGVLYIMMQHAADKYQLLYVRPRIKGRGSIARTSMHATIWSLLIYQAAMAGFFLVRATKTQSACILILLMTTYIVALFWYIQDKERSYGRTQKYCAHESEGRLLQRDLNASKMKLSVTDDLSDPHESTFLLSHPWNCISSHTGRTRSMTRQCESDLYREPALRNYGVRRMPTSATMLPVNDRVVENLQDPSSLPMTLEELNEANAHKLCDLSSSEYGTV